MRKCNYSDIDNEIWLKAAESISGLGMIIFDPAKQVLKNGSSNSTERDGYEKMAYFAKRLDCACIGIGHTIKVTKGKDIYARIAGTGLGQVARSIIMIVTFKGGALEDGSTHLMILVKTYAEPVNYGVTYKIETCYINDEYGEKIKTAKIVWLGVIPGTPEELLEWADRGGKMVVDGEDDKLTAAVYFLKRTLQNGPVPVKDVKEKAKIDHITVRKLDDAKNLLGVVHYKGKGEGQHSPFYWSLPEKEPT